MNKNWLYALVCCSVLSACTDQSKGAARNNPAIPVIVADVHVQDVALYFDSLGTLKPSAFIEIRPQVSGMLASIDFAEGQFVSKGDPLFTIESANYEIALQEATAKLNQDQAALDIASQKLERYRNVAKKDLISKQEWDELQASVAQNEAQVQGDRARVESAKLNVDRCLITASIDGMIGKAMIHPGNLITGGQATPLTTLSVIDPLKIDFTLTEKEYSLLTQEQKKGSVVIEICSLCNAGDTAKASLSFLDHAYDAKTGLLHVQAILINADHKFLPGQHIKVRIPVQVNHNALTAPQKAVKINQKGPYVFVVKSDETVEIRQITTGDEIDDRIVVVTGLTKDDKVVTDGHLRLSPGLKVAVKSE